MDVAQKLYQNGHITYMRTDSVNLSNEAMNACQSFIQKEFGMGYALPNGRKFTTKQASAQEAHEAIRPTHMENTPESILLSDGEKKLYKLIWERTVASQMKEATVELTTYFFETKMGDDWIAKGEVIKFPGFMKLYVEGTDDEEGEKFEAKKLPEIRENEVLFAKKITASQKFSLPPARYTEASLVKKLEQEGIGRPSTYAPTIQTIQDRGYVTLESKKLLPTDVAFVVTDFLESEFSEFMKYSFTAEIENKFDKIAAGDLAWQKMLSDFYNPFHQLVEEAAGMEGKFSGERIL